MLWKRKFLPRNIALIYDLSPPPQLRLNPSAMKSRLMQYLATSFPGTQAVVSSREDLLRMIYTGGDKRRNQIYSFSLMGISLPSPPYM